MKWSRLLVPACVFLAACGEQATRSVEPPSFSHGGGGGSTPAGCAQPDSARKLIDALFRSDSRSSTRSRYDQLVQKSSNQSPAQLQSQAIQLVDFILKKYHAGHLIGGTSIATQNKVIALLNAVLCAVGLPQSFGPGSLSDEHAAAVIYPATQDTNVVTGTKFAGVTIPQGSVTVPTLVQIDRLPGTGPLATLLDQYPLFYEYDATPAQTFTHDVTVGVCLANNATPPDPSRLRVAHNVAAGGIEIAPLAIVGFLDCTNANVAAVPGSVLRDLARGGRRLLRDAFAMLGPQQLYAFAGTGIGGTVRTFSPFGLVDPFAVMTMSAPAVQYANPLIPPAVTITTPLGRPLPDIPVLFTKDRGILTGGNTVTNASGFASATFWSPNDANPSIATATATAPTGVTIGGNPALFFGYQPKP